MSITGKKFKAPPRTAMEVFEMLPEGTLAEVINNVIYMSPAPLFNHQDVLSDLHTTMNLVHQGKPARKVFGFSIRCFL